MLQSLHHLLVRLHAHVHVMLGSLSSCNGCKGLHTADAELPVVVPRERERARERERENKNENEKEKESENVSIDVWEDKHRA